MKKLLFSFLLFGLSVTTALAHSERDSFKTAIYVMKNSVNALADEALAERELARITDQLHFDKVYLEVYRSGALVDEESLIKAIKFFEARGIKTATGITPEAGSRAGQFNALDYENPEHRQELLEAVELAARHFDEIILDDFFFFNSKTDANIRAKGKRSWTEYRLDTMRKVSQDLVIKPARKIRPDVKLIIKYPNWHEHFQAAGFDLEQQPEMFDGIYTGTETRDPDITDQLLQQYHSYSNYRYFENIAPGRNGGGWVDPYSLQYADRYAEQLWLTAFAGAKEITLFNWNDLAGETPAPKGARQAWAAQSTTVDFASLSGDGFAAIAAQALDKADTAMKRAGNPIGLASYKPTGSHGEDFLHSFLGNVGIPMEMTAEFPIDADVIFLTESAKFDPELISKIKSALRKGKSVIATQGLYAAMPEAMSDIVELQMTGRTVMLERYIGGHGAGAGTALNTPDNTKPVLFSEMQFFTNDSWPLIRGVASSKGFPIMLMNDYSKGTFYVLNTPQNMGDLYNLPKGVLNHIKRYMLADFPVRLYAEPKVSLFAYDNDTAIITNFRDEPAQVTFAILGENKNLKDAKNVAIKAGEDVDGEFNYSEFGTRTDVKPRSYFQVTIPPHSFRQFRWSE